MAYSVENFALKPNWCGEKILLESKNFTTLTDTSFSSILLRAGKRDMGLYEFQSPLSPPFLYNGIT